MSAPAPRKGAPGAPPVSPAPLAGEPGRGLRELSSAQQLQMAGWIDKEGTRGARERARAEFQVEADEAELAGFHAWFYLGLPLDQAAALIRSAAGPGGAGRDIPLDDDTLSRALQLVFEARALAANDADLFINLRKLRHKDRDLALETRKVAALEAKAGRDDPDDPDANAHKLTPEQKSARIRELFGIKP